MESLSQRRNAFIISISMNSFLIFVIIFIANVLIIELLEDTRHPYTCTNTCVSITQNTLLLIYIVHMLVLFFIFKRTKQSWQDGSGG